MLRANPLKKSRRGGQRREKQDQIYLGGPASGRATGPWWGHAGL